MIKFRQGTLQQKLFYRAEKVRWDISRIDEEKKLIIIINVDCNNPRFAKGKDSLGILDKKLVDRFKKDLKNGFIYDDRFSEDDTEYLDQESKPGKYLVYTKRINGPDRFSYIIYEPILRELTEDEEIYEININVYSCKGHIGPSGKSYFQIR